PPPEQSREEQREELKKTLSSWWDRVKDGPLGNSETLRELGRNFTQPFTGAREHGMGTESLLEKLPQLGKYIPFKDVLSHGLPPISRPHWPSASPSVGAIDG